MDDVDSDLFETFEKVHTDRVKVDDLITFLIKKHQIPETESIVKVVDSFDTHNIGALNKEEYMALMKHMRQDDFQELNLKNFDAFDMNKDGFIDAFELFVILNDMKKLTLYDTAVQMVQRADRNNDNKIDREEFKDLFEGFIEEE